MGPREKLNAINGASKPIGGAERVWKNGEDHPTGISGLNGILQQVHHSELSEVQSGSGFRAAKDQRCLRVRQS
jgi:hypothetical protein